MPKVGVKDITGTKNGQKFQNLKPELEGRFNYIISCPNVFTKKMEKLRRLFQKCDPVRFIEDLTGSRFQFGSLHITHNLEVSDAVFKRPNTIEINFRKKACKIYGKICHELVHVALWELRWTTQSSIASILEKNGGLQDLIEDTLAFFVSAAIQHRLGMCKLGHEALAPARLWPIAKKMWPDWLTYLDQPRHSIRGWLAAEFERHFK